MVTAVTVTDSLPSFPPYGDEEEDGIMSAN